MHNLLHTCDFIDFFMEKMDMEVPILSGTLIVPQQSSFSSFNRISKKVNVLETLSNYTWLIEIYYTTYFVIQCQPIRWLLSSPNDANDNQTLN